MNLTPDLLLELAASAWRCCDRAYSLGTTKVGAAVLTDDGSRFTGCNVEHRYRSHDVHAEVNAISTMVAEGHTHLTAIVLVSERPQLTPCGACLDWILQFGGPSCIVGWQSSQSGQISTQTAGELMPYHPPYE